MAQVADLMASADKSLLDNAAELLRRAIELEPNTLSHRESTHWPVVGLQTWVPQSTPHPLSTHAPSLQICELPHCTHSQLATQAPSRQN